MTQFSDPQKDVISERYYWKIFFILMMIGICLRVAVIVWIPTVPTGDFWSYFQRTNNLATKGVYEAIAGRPDASYPPLYPIVLSLFFRFASNQLLIAKFVNLYLNLISLWFISQIAREIFNNKTSIITMGIMVLNPRNILSVNIIASENLFIPLISMIIFLLVVRRKNPMLEGYRLYIFTGMLSGLAILTRAVAAAFAFPIILSELPLKQKFHVLLRKFLLIILFQFIILLPWAARNYFALHKMIFSTSTGGINLFIGNNPNSTGEWYPWINDLETVDKNFSNETIIEQDNIAGRTALQWMIQHPLDVIKNTFHKWELMFRGDQFIVEMAITGRQLSPPVPPSDVILDDLPIKSAKSILILIVNIFFFITLIFECSGLILTFPFNKRNNDSVFRHQWLILFLCALYFPAISAFFIASSRFIWPTFDILMPFAGFSLYYLSEKRLIKNIKYLNSNAR